MNLAEMLEQVRSLPSGDYAECGVYKGDSAVLISAGMNPDSTLWLLDSFQGHGEPGPNDDSREHPKGRYGDTDIDSVMLRLGDVRDINYIPGFIPESLGNIPPEWKFRFVHIDVDHYAPTKAACEFFLPRMVPGGIIRFDDYSCVRGARKAIDEVVGPERLIDGDWRYEAR